jgi:hypothetical protein
MYDVIADALLFPPLLFCFSTLVQNISNIQKEEEDIYSTGSSNGRLSLDVLCRTKRNANQRGGIVTEPLFS